MPSEPTARPLRRLWRHAGRHRPRLVVAAAASVLNKTFDIAPPFLIGAAIDIVVVGDQSFIATRFGVPDPRDQLLVLAVITAVVWALESLFEYIYRVLWRNLAQDVQHDLRVETYAHAQGLEMAYFTERQTGDLLAVLNDDVNQLERFLDVGANEILQLCTTVVLVGGAFVVLVGDLAWLAFLPVPVIVVGSVRFQRSLEPRYAQVRARAGQLAAMLSNNLHGLATIKAFTAEDREVDRIAAQSVRYAEANRDAIRLSSAFVPLIRIAILCGFTALMVFGGLRALDGQLDVGIYSVLVFLTQRLLWPLTRLGETFDQYQRGMASTRRILDLLEERPRIAEGTDEPARPVAGAVTFEGVTFGYDPVAPVLRDLDLHVPAGQTHAIVGATGAGKSTMVKLLLRLYDPDAGRVLLDGIDVATLTFAGLRGTMGVVGQDVFLFHGSVADNLLLGLRNGATDPAPDEVAARLRRSAALAEADGFVAALPDGYDTIIGERGQKLSGGQRQRLSIARALLTDPAVFVLDEATSAVDNETEAAIQRSLERVARDRTTIVIAHRLSTIRGADRIHVLADGRVVEAGTHDELVAADGRYAALWRVQTGGGVASTV